MSYEFYPEALANVIRAVHEEYKGAIVVTENGCESTGGNLGKIYELDV